MNLRPDVDEDRKFSESRFNVLVPLRSDRTLVFNSVTERMVLLSADETSSLYHPNNTQTSEQQDSLKRLAAGGFIVRHSHDELSWVKERYERKRNAKHSLTVTIVTTLGCNLACGYCFQGKDKPQSRLTDKARDGLIEYLQRKASGLERLNIVWFGGEPLMNAAEIWRTSAELKDICTAGSVSYNAAIVTNGYLLTPEIGEKLVEAGVTSAQVTVDGLQSSHDRMRPHISGRGSFDRIIKNLHKVVANDKLHISLRISVDANNADGIRQLLSYLAEQGFSGRKNLSVYFAPIEAISAGCADYESLTLSKRAYAELEIELLELAVRLKLHRHQSFGQDGSLCQAVRPMDLVLNSNGDLHKCWDTISFERLKVANVADADFEAMLAENSWTKWTATSNEICASCKILPICGGGCAFKTVHSDEQSGEAASLPCISLKFNLAERLFMVARAAGVVEADDWDPDLSPTFINGELKTGPSHYPGSIKPLH